jgi:hypothetical protein
MTHGGKQPENLVLLMAAIGTDDHDKLKGLGFVSVREVLVNESLNYAQKRTAVLQKCIKPRKTRFCGCTGSCGDDRQNKKEARPGHYRELASWRGSRFPEGRPTGSILPMEQLRQHGKLLRSCTRTER